MRLLFAPILACICLLAAVPAIPAAARTPSVLFFTPSPPETRPFWRDFTDFMSVAAESLGMDLTVVVSRNRYSVLEQARSLLESGERPDYVVFVYQAGNSVDMLPLLEAAGVPSIICNTDVIESERALVGRPREKYKHWIGHLLPDDMQAGRVLAERLIRRGFELGLTGADGKLYMNAVGGTRDASSGLYRKQGLEQAVAANPGVVLERYVWADWKRDKARYKALRLLDLYPEARVFWAVHDGAALGVLDAAGQKGLTPSRDFLTGGIDWTAEGVEAVRRGDLDASLGGHFMDGAWALVMLYDYHNGRDFAEPDPTLHSEMRLMDRDSIDRYLPALDRANWKKIDFKRFCRSCNPELERYDFSPEAVVRQLNGK